jgi:hypothetical protein
LVGRFKRGGAARSCQWFVVMSHEANAWIRKEATFLPHSFIMCPDWNEFIPTFNGKTDRTSKQCVPFQEVDKTLPFLIFLFVEKRSWLAENLGKQL